MPGNARDMITAAERRFPVRVRIGVPPGGFGQRHSQMTGWLDENCGCDGWAWRGSCRAATSIPYIFDTSYHLYPDGPIAVETLRVIGTAMAEATAAGIGRLTLSRRERLVMVEPRGSGMALFTLRAAGEVRAAQFESAEGDLDAEMVAIAGAIIGSGPANSTRPRSATAIRRRCSS